MFEWIAVAALPRPVRAIRLARPPHQALAPCSPLVHCDVDSHIQRMLICMTVFRALLGPVASRLARSVKRLRSFERHL